MNVQLLAPAVPADLRAQFDGLPAEMKQARQWLVWRDKKQPYYVTGRPRSGVLDSADDRRQLGTFEQALKALAGSGYFGLGFAIGPDGTGNHWQGVDLDKLSDHAEFAPLLQAMPGYTEKSPSGNGIHAIGYGRPFRNMGNNKTGIEAYCTGRFFTVTGNVIGGAIADISDWVVGELVPLHRPAKSQKTKNKPVSRETDSALVLEVDSSVLRDLKCALDFLPADDYELWISIGHALATVGEAGRGLWLDWSSKSAKYEAKEAERRWGTFQPRNTSYKAVFAKAQEMGWPNPARIRIAVDVEQKAVEVQGEVGLRALVIDLTGANEIPPEHPHIVERIFPEGEVTLLAGHGGSGKSFVALEISIHVCLGIPIGGLKTRQGAVLYFSAEDGKDELLRRTAAICKQLGRRVEELKGLLHLLDASEIEPSLYGPLRNQRGYMKPLADELAALVTQCQAVFVVIDNASDTYDAEEHVRADVRAFMRGLRQKMARPDRAVLLLAHVNKVAAEHAGGKSFAQDYSGSTAWHNSARSRLSLESNRAGLKLVHKKSNRGPLADPIGVIWQDGVPLLVDDDGGHLGAELVRLAEEQAASSNVAAVLRIIEDFTERGELVPTADRGARTTFAVLGSAPEFPKSLDASRLRNVIRELERQGKVRREIRRAKNRKEIEVFASIVVPSAPLHEVGDAPEMAGGEERNGPASIDECAQS